MSSRPVIEPKPSLRDAQRALTRERLLTGARDLFAEKSYLEATIDGIAARAGVARATVYLHYETKGALAQDLLIQDMTAQRRFYHKLADILDRDGPAPDGEALAGWLRRYAKVFNDRRTALSLFNVVIGSDPDFLQVIKRERDALFDDVGARIAAFRFDATTQGRARRVEAHLLVFQIEQFCGHAVHAPWSDADFNTGVALLSDHLGAFLRAG